MITTFDQVEKTRDALKAAIKQMEEHPYSFEDRVMNVKSHLPELMDLLTWITKKLGLCDEKKKDTYQSLQKTLLDDFESLISSSEDVSIVHEKTVHDLSALFEIVCLTHEALRSKYLQVDPSLEIEKQDWFFSLRDSEWIIGRFSDQLLKLIQLYRQQNLKNPLEHSVLSFLEKLSAASNGCAASSLGDFYLKNGDFEAALIHLKRGNRALAYPEQSYSSYLLLKHFNGKVDMPALIEELIQENVYLKYDYALALLEMEDRPNLCEYHHGFEASREMMEMIQPFFTPDSKKAIKALEEIQHDKHEAKHVLESIRDPKFQEDHLTRSTRESIEMEAERYPRDISIKGYGPKIFSLISGEYPQKNGHKGFLLDNVTYSFIQENEYVQQVWAALKMDAETLSSCSGYDMDQISEYGLLRKGDFEKDPFFRSKQPTPFGQKVLDLAKIVTRQSAYPNDIFSLDIFMNCQDLLLLIAQGQYCDMKNLLASEEVVQKISGVELNYHKVRNAVAQIMKIIKEAHLKLHPDDQYVIDHFNLKIEDQKPMEPKIEDPDQKLLQQQKPLTFSGALDHSKSERHLSGEVMVKRDEQGWNPPHPA